MTIRREFQVHRLNAEGMIKAERLAEAFSTLLDGIEAASNADVAGRELALVRTHLQDACFWAKRAMAVAPENQERVIVANPGTGTFCAMCHALGMREPQVMTPSGPICKFGHGGAPPANIP